MDEIDKIVSFLREIGIRIDMNMFGDRKLFQKLVYLFHEVGLVKENFGFDIYIQGPYSRELARLGFENKDKLIKLKTGYILTDREKEILGRLKDVFGDWLVNTDKMELVASILFLKKKFGKEWKERMRRIKPRFSDEKILVAEQRIKELFFDEDKIPEDLRKELEMWDRLSGELVE